MTEEQKVKVRELNNQIIANKNYRFNSWLPILENPNTRTLEEVKGRMSVMNALINISFEAPITFIRKWIEEHNLTSYLSNWENEILLKDNDELSDQEINSLRWYLEGLWALMWQRKQFQILMKLSGVVIIWQHFYPILKKMKVMKKSTS